jgi:hypothetical protein
VLTLLAPFVSIHVTARTSMYASTPGLSKVVSISTIGPRRIL